MGEPSSKKLLRILVMLVCCAGAGYFFWTTRQVIEENEYSLEEASRPQPPDPASEAEKSEIVAAEEGLENLSKSSSQAMQVALYAEVQNKYPIDLPSSLVAVAPVASGIVEAPVEPDPPMVTVEGILIMDDYKVALVRVDGENSTQLKVGDRFSENKARVTNIDAKGLDYIWMRKKFRVSL
jgi:hypothetical protein